MKILLIEDDAFQRRRFLHTAQRRIQPLCVTETETVHEACADLLKRGHAYDAAVIDYMLPRSLDGGALSAAMRFGDIPRAIWTAADPGPVAEALRESGVPVFTKFETPALIDWLLRLYPSCRKV